MDRTTPWISTALYKAARTMIFGIGKEKRRRAKPGAASFLVSRIGGYSESSSPMMSLMSAMMESDTALSEALSLLRSFQIFSCAVFSLASRSSPVAAKV
jgi:hypothetical protein